MSEINLSDFQRQWHGLAARFGLSVVTPFDVKLGDETIRVPVLLRDFGARYGMLLVTSFDEIAAYADRITQNGYGFSCLSEPSENESNDDEYTSFIDILTDWGWSGEGEPPAWLK